MRVKDGEEGKRREIERREKDSKERCMGGGDEFYKLSQRDDRKGRERVGESGETEINGFTKMVRFRKSSSNRSSSGLLQRGADIS